MEEEDPGITRVSHPEQDPAVVLNVLGPLAGLPLWPRLVGQDPAAEHLVSNPGPGRLVDLAQATRSP